ncbi:MAG: hypothetical protein M3220_18140 [Chloroflexota bacterium]|nr:hypothetical protein [Chloroflexota bacterium]
MAQYKVWTGKEYEEQAEAELKALRDEGTITDFDHQDRWITPEEDDPELVQYVVTVGDENTREAWHVLSSTFRGNVSLMIGE